MVSLVLLVVVVGAFLLGAGSSIAARVSARRSLAELKNDPRFIASRTGGRGEPIARFDDGVAYIEVRPGELSIGAGAARSWELRADLMVRAPFARIHRKRLVIYRPSLAGVNALPPLRAVVHHSRAPPSTASSAAAPSPSSSTAASSSSTSSARTPSTAPPSTPSPSSPAPSWTRPPPRACSSTWAASPARPSPSRGS